MTFYPLNKSQTEAVNYTDGPLIIVAGAGTGKTTVITRKIVHLIKNKLAEPGEILALTFTDKAAEEMESRVDEMIDIGYVDLQISTFHAFCQKILEQYGIDIGIGNKFKLLTPTDAWLLVRRNLDKFDLDYYRPLGNPGSHVHELLAHFSKCKDELISPEEYLEHAENVQLNKDDARADEKSRLTEIANAYHAYNKLLLDNSALDFGDLIYYAVKLLEERPAILDAFRKRFKYILVDEFQDVNWAQYQLVRLLAGEKTQLTVVGDDDQSIYAFRGASVSNILRFEDDYPSAKSIVLNENYRSGQKILDQAYKAIQNNNPDRLECKLGIDKKLRSEKEKPMEGEVIHIHADTLNQEVEAAINEINKIMQSGSGAKYDDFAILVRANSHAEPFFNALEKADIPYEFLAAQGLYRQRVVLDCVNFFRLLDDYHESGAIYRMLCLPFWEFDENDLRKISHGAKKKSVSYYEALKRAAEFGVSKEGQVVISRLLSLAAEGSRDSRHKKPTAIMYDFLEQSGYLSWLTREEARGNRDVIRQIYQLKQFFEYVSVYETATPGASVKNFLEHFCFILESGDQGALYQPSDTPDSVNILTAHKAKGLEFKYVFVVNLVEDRFPARKRGEGIELPSELIKEQLPEGDSHFQEERRLFYVAMTRAKERLYLTSADDYGGARAKKISRFLREMNYATAELEGIHGDLIGKHKARSAKADERGKLVFELPAAFSFSQIKSYNSCPYQYKLGHLLKIPTKGNASFSFGQSMHSTLQKFYERMRDINKSKQAVLFGTPAQAEKKSGGVRAPDLKELLALYEKSWIDDWYKSKSQREEYFELGKEILKKFYEAEEGRWTVPITLEGWFKIKVGDYLVQGRIDRIDQLADGSLEIIDYKTGKAKEKVDGDDKDQLLIYQIAVQQLSEYKHIGVPSKLTYYYLNDISRVSFIGDDSEINKLSDKLAASIKKIHSGNFNPEPSQHNCRYCDFKEICEFRQV